MAAPCVLPRNLLGAPEQPGANDRILVGFIGCGGRARQLMSQLPEEGKIIAACDCEKPRAEWAAEKHSDRSWKIFQNFRRLLDMKEIDAVFVATPDHVRVTPSIMACQAGKDVYAEKPLTVYLREGRALVDAVRRHGRVLQVGSQQRTMQLNEFACRFVREGKLGKLKVVLGVNYPGPRRYTGTAEQPIPAGLDWDLWCGATPLQPYHTERHRPWMAWRAYSGGEMANWGAHGLDQIQWALGMSHTGPVELWPITEGPNGKVGMKYADGTVVRLELDKGPMGGAIFVGADAKMEINRNKFATNPPDFVHDAPPPAVAQSWEGPGWIARPHIQNFFDCMRTRKRPNADVEIGHRSISVSHLANITRELGRRLRWNPDKEQFVDDPKADALLERPRRKGYELPEASA